MLNYADIYKKLVLELNNPLFNEPKFFETLVMLKESEREGKLKKLFNRAGEQNHYLLTQLNIVAQDAGFGLLGDIFLKFSRNYPDLFSPAAAEASLEPPSKRAKVEEDDEDDAKERPSKRQKTIVNEEKTALTDWEAYQIAKDASEGGKGWDSLDLESRKRLACFAAVLGNQAVIEALLKLDMGVDGSILPEPEKATLLYFAAANGHEKLVKFLIGKEAACDIPTDIGATPLWASSAYADDGNVDHKYSAIISYLITNGANIEHSLKDDGSTPLCIACENENTVVLCLLRNHKAKVDLGLGCRMLPLYNACRNGRESIVELLLKYGANTNRGLSDMHTPLYAACQNGHTRVVEMLVNNKKTNIDLGDPRFSPAVVARRNGHQNIAEYLLFVVAWKDSLLKELEKAFARIEQLSPSDKKNLIQMLARHLVSLCTSPFEYRVVKHKFPGFAQTELFKEVHDLLSNKLTQRASQGTLRAVCMSKVVQATSGKLSVEIPALDEWRKSLQKLPAHIKEELQDRKAVKQI